MRYIASLLANLDFFILIKHDIDCVKTIIYFVGGWINLLAMVFYRHKENVSSQLPTSISFYMVNDLKA